MDTRRIIYIILSHTCAISRGQRVRRPVLFGDVKDLATRYCAGNQKSCRVCTRDRYVSNILIAKEDDAP